MRKRVLGAIAALTAGAGAVFGQAPPSAMNPYGAASVVPANYAGGLIPPQLPGPMGPDMGMMGGAGEPAPNGAPSYPPPGYYGAGGYNPMGSGASAATPAILNLWVNVDYLLWFAKAQPVQTPYVTTAGPLQAGVAGQSTTAILSGRQNLGYNVISGFRVDGGKWIGDDRRFGIELGGYLLEQKTNAFYAQSGLNGLPTLARPFTRSGDHQPFALIISQVGVAQGSVLVSTSSQTWGAEGNGLLNLYRSAPGEKCNVSISMLGGFRYAQLHETLNISSASTLIGGGGPQFGGVLVNAPGTIGVRDSFDATNRFYGGQLGFKGDFICGRWLFSATGKIAAGLMNEVLDVNGQSELIDPTRGIASVLQGGLYATGENINRYRHDQFAVIPEGTLTLGYNWTPGITTFIGYNFLYMSRVLRPGTSIPTTVNTSQVPVSLDYGGNGTPADNPSLKQTEFWVQGVTFTMQFRY